MVLERFSGFWLLPILVFLAFLDSSESTNSQMEKLKKFAEWKFLDFDFPSREARDEAIASESFIPGDPVPIDVDVYYGAKDNKSDKVFVTIPRFLHGVPVTLGYVTSKVNDKGQYLIAPYPNWEMQTPGKNCNGITSVYRIAIDSCRRMWIMDTGKLLDQQICPPKLLVYSIEDNTLLKRYEFPKDLYKEASLFVTPIVDIRDDSCDDAFVYIADVSAFGLVVYDHKNSRSWRIVNNLFYPYPNHGTFHINCQTFDLMDGIFGLALGPIKQNGDRTLYFHSLASHVEAHVSTSIIRNYTIFEHDPAASARSFKPFEHERSSQSAAQAMDRDGVLFFGLMTEIAIGCWNSYNCPNFGGHNIEKVVIDKETLQFASGLKIATPRGNMGQELWIMTSSFQRVMTDTLNPNMTNFRIQAASIDNLVRNTKCQVGGLNKC